MRGDMPNEICKLTEKEIYQKTDEFTVKFIKLLAQIFKSKLPSAVKHEIVQDFHKIMQNPKNYTYLKKYLKQ